MGYLSKRQEEILKFINKFIETKNYPPTIREIADAVGLSSTSTVHSHLEKLEKLKYIKRDPDKPRTMEVLREKEVNVDGFHQELLELPVIDRVSGVLNPLSKDNVIEMLTIPARFVEGRNCFILKATENRLSGNGIIKDDYMIVNQTKTAENGKIVVVLINYKKTITARYFFENNKVILKAENDLYETLEYNPEDVNIIGIVVSNFRVIK